MLNWLAEVATAELLIGNQVLQLLVAIALILLAAGLLFLELIIVSGGLLGLLAAGAAFLGCYLAWEIGPSAFYSTLAATPIIAILTIRYGLQRLQQSSMVTQATIDSDAGYQQVATRLGIEPGSTGTLQTSAMPTGRARFKNGEVDVTVQHGAGRKGEKIKVIEIDGPTIWVLVQHKAKD